MFRTAKLVYSLLAASFFSLSIFGQTNEETAPVVVFSKVVSGGFIAHTNGFGGGMEFGRFHGVKRVHTFGFDFVTMKHSKEIRSFNPFYENARSYIFGKTHSLFILRPHWGIVKILTPKIRPSGVQVGLAFDAGASLGFTKPIYLEIGGPGVPYQYVEVVKYDPESHNFENIYGKASGLLGFGEIKFQPGAFVRTSMQFEYANSQDRIKGLEVGISIDGFLKPVEIMAPDYVDKNNQFFLNLFVQLYFGSKKHN